MVVPIHSQAFGSLGAVVAWFRTVELIQVIMENLFQLVILCYVDDCFWATPRFPETGAPDASWVLQVFEYVTTELLGWQLNPDKSNTGVGITLLGLEVTTQADSSYWQLSHDKSQQWVDDVTRFLSEDRLTSAEASKLAGRVAFLNTKVFGRLGRALLRPIIWRQLDLTGATRLTRRLRYSLMRFCKVLQENGSRSIPYALDELKASALVYRCRIKW